MEKDGENKLQNPGMSPDEKAREMRRLAEEKLAGKTKIGGIPLPESNKDALLHELQVHQIELEMQNEELKTAQLELEEARARYFDLYHLAPVGYVKLNQGGLIIDVNLKAAELLGVSRAVLMKRSRFSQYIYPEDQDIYYMFLKKMGEAGKQACELRMQSFTRGHFYAAIHADAAYDTNGEKLYFTTLSDITDRKKAEDIDRLKRYKSLIEQCPEGVIMADPKTMGFKYVNQTICRMLGYSENELLKLQVKDIHPKEFLDLVMKEFEAQMKGEKSFSESLPFIRKDNQVIYVNVNSALTRINEQDFMVGFFTDITEIKKSKEEIKEKESLYRSLIETTDTGYCIIDIEGKIIDANNEYARLAGFDNINEMLGKPVTEWTADYEKEKNAKAVAQCVKDGKIRNLEIDYAGKDGKITPIEINATVIEKNGDKLILSLCRDISIRKETENELLQSQKIDAIGSLAGGISHDFNNFLATILGYSNLFLDDYTRNDKKRKYIEEIKSQAEHASKVVKQLLSFARPQKTSFKLLEIRPIIYDTIKLMESTIKSVADVDVYITSEKCRKFLGDSTQIQQALLNLLKNACDAMSNTKNNRLDIAVDEISLSPGDASYLSIVQGKYLKITIKDTGIGMPPELINRIFEPFFTTKGMGKGTGLGLSIVKSVIKNHNGNITVASGFGKGTTFTIYLPLAESIENNKLKKISKKKNKTHILVVEDNEALLKSYILTLKKSGYILTAAANGEKALKIFLAAPKKFDIVLTDQKMPGMEGDQLSKEILKIRPEMPIIMITGYSTVSEAEAKSIGIRRIISKPVNFPELLDIINVLTNKNTN